MGENMSGLTDAQKKFYEDALEQTRTEVQDLEDQIQVELGKVKETIADLQNAQKAARQMYDAACQRLGIPNDLESDESGS
jgi:hypothetical protein